MKLFSMGFFVKNQIIMKINLKNLLIPILLIIIIVLINRSCNQSKEINMYQNEKKVDTLSIKQWKDKFQQEHTLVKSNEINFANLMNAKDGELAKLRQEISTDKTISGKTIVKTITKQEIKEKVRDSIIYVYNDKKDTISSEKVKLLSYSDKWLKLNGKLFQNDSIKLNYTIDNKFNIYTKYKSNGWFRPKQTYIEIVNENPNTLTNQIQVYTIQQPPKGFFQSRAFNILLGVGIGFVVQNQLNK